MRFLDVAKPLIVLLALPSALLLGLWLVKMREQPKRVSEVVGEEAMFLTLSEPWQRRAWAPDRKFAGD